MRKINKKSRIILPVLAFLSFGMLVGSGLSYNQNSEVKEADAAVPTRFYLAKNSAISKDFRLWDDTAKVETSASGTVKVRGRTLQYFNYTPGNSNTICFSVSGTWWDNERTNDYYTGSDAIIKTDGCNAYSIITNWSGTTQRRQAGYWTKLSGTTTTDCEASLTTAPRIYVDYSIVSNTPYVYNVMFYNDNRLHDDIHYQRYPDNSCVDTYDKFDYRSGSYTNSSNGHFDNTGLSRKVTPLTVPWDAFKVKVTMSNGVSSDIMTIPAKNDNKTCLRAYYDANSQVKWKWVIPEHQTGEYIYLNYTSSNSTWKGNDPSAITAEFSTGYYSTDNYTAVAAGDVSTETGSDGDTYVKIKVPDYATKVKFRRGANTYSSEIILAVTDNVHYVVNSSPNYTADYVYILPELGSLTTPVGSDYTVPAYNTARIFMNCSANTSTGEWANQSNIFGVSTWKNAHPTYCKTASDDFVVYRMSYVDNPTDNRRYYYVDVPHDIGHFLFIIMNANGTPIYDSMTVEDVTTSPHSSFSYCYAITGGDGERSTHVATDVTCGTENYTIGDAILTKLLVARNMCSNNVYNGFGDGAEVYDNFYKVPNPYSAGNVTTLEATNSYKIDYVMDCLNHRQTSGKHYGQATDVEKAFIALNNSNVLIIFIISSVSVVTLMSVGLVTLRRKKQHKK